MKITASTRLIHSCHRRSGGELAKARSNDRLLAAFSGGGAMVPHLEPVEAGGGLPGQLADGTEGDQSIEQAAGCAL
nr:hypothetical protein [Azospirillum sp. TSA2s]